MMKAAAEHLARTELQLDINWSPTLHRNLHDITSLTRRFLQGNFRQRFTGVQKVGDELPRAVFRECFFRLGVNRSERLPLRGLATSEFRRPRLAAPTQPRKLSTDRDHTSGRLGRNLVDHL